MARLPRYFVPGVPLYLPSEQANSETCVMASVLSFSRDPDRRRHQCARERTAEARRGSASNRARLAGDYEPLIGAALVGEYEDVLCREALWEGSLLAPEQRSEVFEDFLSVCCWVEVFFAWRPSLPDEADNHLVELAVAGNAKAIVTRNTRDLARGELRFPSLKILTPEQCLESYPCRP